MDWLTPEVVIAFITGLPAIILAVAALVKSTRAERTAEEARSFTTERFKG